MRSHKKQVKGRNAFISDPGCTVFFRAAEKEQSVLTLERFILIRAVKGNFDFRSLVSLG